MSSLKADCHCKLEYRFRCAITLRFSLKLHPPRRYDATHKTDAYRTEINLKEIIGLKRTIIRCLDICL